MKNPTKKDEIHFSFQYHYLRTLGESWIDSNDV